MADSDVTCPQYGYGNVTHTYIHTYIRTLLQLLLLHWQLPVKFLRQTASDDLECACNFVWACRTGPPEKGGAICPAKFLPLDLRMMLTCHQARCVSQLPATTTKPSQYQQCCFTSFGYETLKYGEVLISGV
jgi:hypothetical protein